MEVHHHPHVGKKSFKEYVLEGIMIFIAVSMGFIAENIREHFVEKETEIKYVKSYLEDLKSDMLRFDRIIKGNSQEVSYIDETLKLLHQTLITDSISKRLYFLNAVNHSYYNMLFNKRTANQLKMAGGYKIISKQIVSDSMAKRDINIDWNDMMRERLYNLSFEISAKAVSKIFDNYEIYNFLNTDKKDSVGKSVITIDSTNFKKLIPAYKKVQLLTSNKMDIVLYSNFIISFQRLVVGYNNSLKDYKQSCLNLIALIVKEYHLEKE